MKFNHTPIKLLFTFSVLTVCNSAFACNEFGIVAINWHTKGHSKHWWNIANAYKILINIEVTSDADPQQLYRHNETFSTYFFNNLGPGRWNTNGGYCYKDMISKIKPDKNGITHVKLFIIVKRKGFNTNKPETVYLDIKNKKTAKITWLSENNWHSEYRKFNKNIKYKLHDNDSN